MLLNSCASITPKVENQQTANFSGNDQNAGILTYLSNHSALLNAEAHARYNAWVKKYGHIFTPPIEEDYGIIQLQNGYCELTKEAAGKWDEMIHYNKREATEKAGSLFK